MIGESRIVYESGDFWVDNNSKQYTVYKYGITHAKADSSYPLTVDGLNLAITRVNYLAKHSKGLPK